MAKLAFENALLYQNEVLHPKWIVGPLLHSFIFSHLRSRLCHLAEAVSRSSAISWRKSATVLRHSQSVNFRHIWHQAGTDSMGMRARNLDWRGESGEIRPCRIDGGVLVSTLQVRQRRHAEDGSLASLILEPNVNC